MKDLIRAAVARNLERQGLKGKGLKGKGLKGKSKPKPRRSGHGRAR